MKKLFRIEIMGLLLAIVILVIYFAFIRNNKVILSCSMLENKTEYFAYDKDTFYWEWGAEDKLWQQSFKFKEIDNNSFVIDFYEDEPVNAYSDMDMILKVKKNIPSIEYTLKGKTVGDARLCKKISNLALNKI